MSDPIDPTVPAEGATDVPEATGLDAEMASLRERLAAYEQAEAKRAAEAKAADAKLLEEADALTRSQAERDHLKAELESRDGVLAELAKSQLAGLALDKGTAALLKGLPAKDQLAWIAKHGAGYRRDAAPATRTAAEAATDYAQMSATQLQAAVAAEMLKHKCPPSQLGRHNPALYAAYKAATTLH